ncbi:hypothetical protein VFPPC_16827 [Pochonia chlamydosporia 170]|uniref:Uncharacterized protein n=1 Tax=Pochonia chlamydosporia 170 TaxID=1380566 RepID=A0A179F3T5_METCM|nr:hypothetical protein VFPPC_16827 [Pochonia chlamydosporia 170]OAQ60020.1 hypothetical protein VFPPC_16827 [Pochonia chlamydosporia 170]
MVPPFAELTKLSTGLFVPYGRCQQLSSLEKRMQLDSYDQRYEETLSAVSTRPSALAEE